MSPELIALKRLSTSCPTALMPELLELSLAGEDAAEVEVEAAVLGIAYVSRVVRAPCAPAMLFSESAVETLAKNSLIGLLESVVDEEVEEFSFSTSAKYFLASVVSPDLIEENRPESALFSELWLLLDVDDNDDAESAVNKEDVLCKAEIDMNCNPFRTDFPVPLL